MLTNAASRTLLICRAHREFAANPENRVPFDAFARKLIQTSATRGGMAADRVRIAGGSTGCGVRISFPATIQPARTLEPALLSLH